jgi:tetratricopeptide (TPR) repeat protein
MSILDNLIARRALTGLTGLVLATAACAVSVFGQESPSAKPNPEQAGGSASKSRERRATQTTEAGDSTTDPQRGTENSGNADPLAALQEQINNTTDADERAQLQLKLANQLAEQGKKTEAIAELRSMLADNRFDPQGFYNLGNALARLGEAESAVTAYRRAIDQRKGRYTRALNNLGVVLLRLERWDEAYDALLSALRLENFRYPEASYNLGRAYAARGESDMAVREWKRTLALDPKHAAAAQAIATLNSGDEVAVTKTTVSKADKAVSSPRAATSQPKAPSTKVDERAPGSKAVKPRLDAKRTLAVDSQTNDFLQRARRARERGHNEDAIANYKRVISCMNGYFPPANLEMSYVLITIHRNDEAIVNLKLVSERDGSRYPISYYYLGRLYEVAGDLKAAEEGYREAATAGLANPQFLLDVGRVREKLGDLKGALEALEEYVRVLDAEGRKPDWSDDRLADLRKKIAANRP